MARITRTSHASSHASTQKYHNSARSVVAESAEPLPLRIIYVILKGRNLSLRSNRNNAACQRVEYGRNVFL